jgi:hypothetical protein
MGSRDDGGQVILLAGILLVIAFVAFSIQLSVLPSLGQQLGRETENPLLEDFLLVRRTFETLVPDELRNPAQSTQFVCPDGFEYMQKVRGQLSLLAALEGTRGQSFSWERLEVERMGGTTTNFEVRITMRLTDGITTVGDSVEYRFKCTTGTGTGCSPMCVAVP